jgi:hypothetical protein
MILFDFLKFITIKNSANIGTDAPTGQVVRRPYLVEADDLGLVVLAGKDSTFSAYSKVGTLVIAAGVVTWFGVPLLAALAQYFIQSIKSIV